MTKYTSDSIGPAEGRYQARIDENAVSYAASVTPPVIRRLAARQKRAELSARELEVLQLLTKGRSNKEISAALFVSEDTVKAHLKTLFVKLGVKDRTEAAIYAVRHGIVHLD